MKAAIAAFILVCVCCVGPMYGQGRAHPMAGVQMLDRQLRIKQRVFIPNFVLSQSKKRTVILASRLHAGLELAYSRSIRARTGEVGQAVVNNQFVISTPLYLRYFVCGPFFIESGIFGGAIVKSGNNQATVWGRFELPSYVAVSGDAGLEGSVGWAANDWSYIRLRYVHGLFWASPWPAEPPVRNRHIELGITLDL